MLPAYAGMILFGIPARLMLTCAPRVCGDDPTVSFSVPASHVVLPAYAGMIPPPTTCRRESPRAPRVCGDDPTAPMTAPAPEMCSPRMRG